MGTDEPQRGYDSRPIPDPTVLTTTALEREILHLRELLEDKITAERELREQQQKASQEAIAKTESLSNQNVEALRREIGDLKDRIGRVEFGPAPPSG
jgi:hypothetical protein